jgi:hypothetical protein
MWWRFIDSAGDFVPFNDLARTVYAAQEYDVFLAAVMLPREFNDHLWVESEKNPRTSWTRDALEEYIRVAEEHGIMDVSRLTPEVYRACVFFLSELDTESSSH